MSAGIKRMLAEKSDRAEALEMARKLDQKWDQMIEDTMALVDKAAEHIDQDCPPSKLAPSARLKVAFFVLATCSTEGAEKRALLFVLDMLDKARERFRQGFHPDPWPDQPRARI